MSDDIEPPDLKAYKLAWLLWCLVLTVPVILLVMLLYIINMFVGVIAAYVAMYSVGAGLALYSFALIAIASIGLYRRSRGLPAWEPWPIHPFAVKLQGIAKHID